MKNKKYAKVEYKKKQVITSKAKTAKTTSKIAEKIITYCKKDVLTLVCRKFQTKVLFLT